jgi:hypothetical protein
MRTLQERVDDAFQVWGRAAPPMRADEDNRRYIQRVARIAQKGKYLAYDAKTKGIDFDQLPREALPIFTNMLLDEIKQSVTRSDTVPDGEERAIFARDEQTGLATRSFVRPGGRSFVDQFMGRIQRVTRINATAQQALYSSKTESRGLW